MDIIEKIIEAEQRPDKALALGIAVFMGYEPVTASEYCEMYYILHKWQSKLGVGRLKSLDELIEQYRKEFTVNEISEAIEAYVDMRTITDKVHGCSCVRAILSRSDEDQDACNNTMPDYEEAPRGKASFVFPIFIDPSKPVS